MNATSSHYRWLVSCPASDINFLSAVKVASEADLRSALEQNLTKFARQKIESRLRSLAKASQKSSHYPQPPKPKAQSPKPKSQSQKPKAQSPTSNAFIIAARRRCFFSVCNARALDNDTQMLIADRFIPEDHPDRWDKSTGALSRKAIFSDGRIFFEVMQHLSPDQKSVRKDLHAPDDLASRSMYGQAFKLARRLGWDERGDDDLRFRLQKFASRQLSNSSGIIFLFEALTSSQLSKVIEGLKAMAKRKPGSTTC
jgi:hypothetical protein